MSKPKISTVLTRAANWIDEHGLAKGDYWKHRNGRPLATYLFSDRELLEATAVAREKGCKACTWGGIYVGTYRPGLDPRSFIDITAEAAVYVSRVIDGAFIPDWNDSPIRTKEEVVQTLKEAAKAARKDGK